MPFKTAEELNLTEDQRCGLIKTLAVLESGKLKDEFSICFTMRTWSGACGTACCIGGTAEALGQCKYIPSKWSRPGWFGRDETVKAISEELYKLFFPNHTQVVGAAHMASGAWMATEKQAAVALRHYLTTGKENWKMAMETLR